MLVCIPQIQYPYNSYYLWNKWIQSQSLECGTHNDFSVKSPFMKPMLCLLKEKVRVKYSCFLFLSDSLWLQLSPSRKDENIHLPLQAPTKNIPVSFIYVVAIYNKVYRVGLCCYDSIQTVGNMFTYFILILIKEDIHLTTSKRNELSKWRNSLPACNSLLEAGTNKSNEEMELVFSTWAGYEY